MSRIGRRGLSNFEIGVDASIQKLEDYIKKQKKIKCNGHE